MRFEVFAAKITVYWDVTFQGWVGNYRRFGRRCHLHNEGLMFVTSTAKLWTSKMKAPGFSEPSVTNYPITQSHPIHNHAESSHTQSRRVIPYIITQSHPIHNHAASSHTQSRSVIPERIPSLEQTLFSEVSLSNTTIGQGIQVGMECTSVKWCEVTWFMWSDLVL